MTASGLLAIFLLAADFHGRVIGITDGDTIAVRKNDGIEVAVRLDAIDAPEHGQPFSNAARKHLTALIYQERVRVDEGDTDRYGRIIGRVHIRERDISLEMLRAGYAWHYKKYNSEERLAAAEARARRGRVGLWGLSGAVPPWEWRARKRAATLIPPANSPDFICGTRRSCGEMTSCEQARFHLQQCGLQALDSDGDGVPCEALCG